MSSSKENTTFTQFSLSSDSINFEDSALISGILEDLTNSRMSVQKENSELHSEIELINEDRQRLRMEIETLKDKLEKAKLKTVHIELLSKVATNALEKNYLTEKMNKIGPKTLSEPKIPNTEKKVENNGKMSPILKRYLVSRTTSSTSPLIIYRSTSRLTTYRTLIHK